MTPMTPMTEPPADDLVEIELVPVEVFGYDGDQCDHCTEHASYGLADAVQAWSDCNRAEGRIYRVEDRDADEGIPSRYRRPGDTIGVFIRRADLPWLQKRHGDRFEHQAEPEATRELAWGPGRWWQVLAPDGSLWCGTSDEQEARAAMRPGDRLQRLMQRVEQRWIDVEATS